MYFSDCKYELVGYTTSVPLLIVSKSPFITTRLFRSIKEILRDHLFTAINVVHLKMLDRKFKLFIVM